MKKIEITAFDIAERFLNLSEVKGTIDNVQIMAMLHLDTDWPQHDEVPWCSAFVNYVCWLLRLPRTRSLAAISWETVGSPITLDDAIKGFDIVVLKRGTGRQRHVGFFAGTNNATVLLLGGNQNNQVNVSAYDVKNVTAVRRLYGGC